MGKHKVASTKRKQTLQLKETKKTRGSSSDFGSTLEFSGRFAAVTASSQGSKTSSMDPNLAIFLEEMNSLADDPAKVDTSVPVPNGVPASDDTKIQTQVEAQPQPTTVASPSTVASPGSSNVTFWQAVVDPKTNHTYYWDPETNSVVWTLPAGGVIATPEVGASGPPVVGVAGKEDEDGETVEELMGNYPYLKQPLVAPKPASEEAAEDSAAVQSGAAAHTTDGPTTGVDDKAATKMGTKRKTTSEEESSPLVRNLPSTAAGAEGSQQVAKKPRLGSGGGGGGGGGQSPGESDDSTPSRKKGPAAPLTPGSAVKSKKIEQEMRFKVSNMTDQFSRKLDYLHVTVQQLTSLELLAIQLQTRLADWKEGGLSTKHMLDKLKIMNEDLSLCETTAAPEGWKYVWDSCTCRYQFLNTSTGELTWEAPVQGPFSPETVMDSQDDDVDTEQETADADSAVGVASEEEEEADKEEGEDEEEGEHECPMVGPSLPPPAQATPTQQQDPIVVPPPPAPVPVADLVQPVHPPLPTAHQDLFFPISPVSSQEEEKEEEKEEEEEEEREEGSGKGSSKAHGGYFGPTAEYLHSHSKDSEVVVPPRYNKKAVALQRQKEERERLAKMEKENKASKAITISEVREKLYSKLPYRKWAKLNSSSSSSSQERPPIEVEDRPDPPPRQPDEDSELICEYPPRGGEETPFTDTVGVKPSKPNKTELGATTAPILPSRPQQEGFVMTTAPVLPSRPQQAGFGTITATFPVTSRPQQAVSAATAPVQPSRPQQAGFGTIKAPFPVTSRPQELSTPASPLQPSRPQQAEFGTTTATIPPSEVLEKAVSTTTESRLMSTEPPSHHMQTGELVFSSDPAIAEQQKALYSHKQDNSGGGPTDAKQQKALYSHTQDSDGTGAEVSADDVAASTGTPPEGEEKEKRLREKLILHSFKIGRGNDVAPQVPEEPVVRVAESPVVHASEARIEPETGILEGEPGEIMDDSNVEAEEEGETTGARGLEPELEEGEERSEGEIDDGPMVDVRVGTCYMDGEERGVAGEEGELKSGELSPGEEEEASYKSSRKTSKSHSRKSRSPDTYRYKSRKKSHRHHDSDYSDDKYSDGGYKRSGEGRRRSSHHSSSKRKDRYRDDSDSDEYYSSSRKKRGGRDRSHSDERDRYATSKSSRRSGKSSSSHYYGSSGRYRSRSRSRSYESDQDRKKSGSSGSKHKKKDKRKKRSRRSSSRNKDGSGDDKSTKPAPNVLIGKVGKISTVRPLGQEKKADETEAKPLGAPAEGGYALVANVDPQQMSATYYQQPSTGQVPYYSSYAYPYPYTQDTYQQPPPEEQQQQEVEPPVVEEQPAQPEWQWGGADPVQWAAARTEQELAAQQGGGSDSEVVTSDEVTATVGVEGETSQPPLPVVPAEGEAPQPPSVDVVCAEVQPPQPPAFSMEGEAPQPLPVAVYSVEEEEPPRPSLEVGVVSVEGEFPPPPPVEEEWPPPMPDAEMVVFTEGMVEPPQTLESTAVLQEEVDAVLEEEVSTSLPAADVEVVSEPPQMLESVTLLAETVAEIEVVCEPQETMETVPSAEPVPTDISESSVVVVVAESGIEDVVIAESAVLVEPTLEVLITAEPPVSESRYQFTNLSPVSTTCVVEELREVIIGSHSVVAPELPPPPPPPPPGAPVTESFRREPPIPDDQPPTGGRSSNTAESAHDEAPTLDEALTGEQSVVPADDSAEAGDSDALYGTMGGAKDTAGEIEECEMEIESEHNSPGHTGNAGGEGLGVPVGVVPAGGASSDGAATEEPSETSVESDKPVPPQTGDGEDTKAPETSTEVASTTAGVPTGDAPPAATDGQSVAVSSPAAYFQAATSSAGAYSYATAYNQQQAYNYAYAQNYNYAQQAAYMQQAAYGAAAYGMQPAQYYYGAAAYGGYPPAAAAATAAAPYYGAYNSSGYQSPSQVPVQQSMPSPASVAPADATADGKKKGDFSLPGNKEKQLKSMMDKWKSFKEDL